MSNNPFRNALSGQPTGQSTTSPISTTPSGFAPPPGPPPPLAISRAADAPPTPIAAPAPEVTVTTEGDPDEGSSEPPPPYTLTPQRWVGEETVQLGPRHPFEAAPAPLRPIPPQNTSSSASSARPRPTVSTNHRPSNSVGNPPSSASYQSPPGPPPRHPSTRIPSNPTTNNSPARRRNSGTFASGWNDSPSPMPGDYPAPAGPPPQSSSSLRPPAASPALTRRRSEGGGQYQPPPHPPPSTSPPAPASTTQSVANDSKPTRNPIPGHPLMYNGKVLVYPPRYTCHKCYNLGYKELDVNHPCRKCWEKYGRPYDGALQYADWTDVTTNFQRPLPQGIRIPQRDAGRSRGPTSPTSPSIHPVHSYGGPPPGALIVQPGDPRIGGRLCWNCGGSGLVPMFLFGEDTCDVCRGTGRTF